MINYPLRGRANSYLGCETPPALTVEWIYTHSFRTKGDDLWKSKHGGNFSNWGVRSHWVDLIFCLSFSSFFLFFFYPTSLASLLLKRLSHAGQSDKIGSVLCVLSYWPLYPKLLCSILSSVYTSFFFLLFFCCHGWSGIYGRINGK